MLVLKITGEEKTDFSLPSLYQMWVSLSVWTLMSQAGLEDLGSLAPHSSVLQFLLGAVRLCLAVTKDCRLGICSILTLKPSDGSGRERLFPGGRSISLCGTAFKQLGWAGILFSPGTLANPNLPRLKSETPQLNISDMRSGLELSSSKYSIINRLAYHLQYGNLK